MPAKDSDFRFFGVKLLRTERSPQSLPGCLLSSSDRLGLLPRAHQGQGSYCERMEDHSSIRDGE